MWAPIARRRRIACETELSADPHIPGLVVAPRLMISTSRPGRGSPIRDGRSVLRIFIHSLERSRKYLGIGPNIYDDRLWKELGISPPRPRIDPAFLQSQFWQYSRDERNPPEPTRFSRTLAEIDAPNVRLLMHANVTQINTSEDGARVKSLEVRTLNGRRAKVKAKAVVLACGALENARLLLASNKIARNGVGNSHDLVGRFLMDHPGCTLGWFDPRRSAPIQSRFGHYWFDHEGGRNLYTFGLMLSPEIQRKEQLLNCAAFLGKRHRLMSLGAH